MDILSKNTVPIYYAENGQSHINQNESSQRIDIDNCLLNSEYQKQPALPILSGSSTLTSSKHGPLSICDLVFTVISLSLYVCNLIFDILIIQTLIRLKAEKESINVMISDTKSILENQNPVTAYIICFWAATIALFTYIFTSHILSLKWYNRRFQATLLRRARSAYRQGKFSTFNDRAYRQQSVPIPNHHDDLDQQSEGIKKETNAVNSIDSNLAITTDTERQSKVLSNHTTPQQQGISTVFHTNSRVFAGTNLQNVLGRNDSQILQFYLSSRYYIYDLLIFFGPLLIIHFFQLHIVWRHFEMFLPKRNRKLMIEQFNHLSLLRLLQGLLQCMPYFIIKSFLLIQQYLLYRSKQEDALSSINTGIEPWLWYSPNEWFNLLQKSSKMHALSTLNGTKSQIFIIDPYIFIASLCISLIGFAWALSTYDKRVHLNGTKETEKLSETHLTWPGIIVKSFYSACLFASRTIIFLLFVMTTIVWAFGLFLFHWFIMVIWLLIYKNNPHPTPLKEQHHSRLLNKNHQANISNNVNSNMRETKSTIANQRLKHCLQNIRIIFKSYNTVLHFFRSMAYSIGIGMVYTFIYINLQGGDSKFRLTLYYMLIFLENTFMSILWLHKVTRMGGSGSSLRIKLFLLVASYVLFFLGLVMLLMYYRFFHNNRPSLISVDTCSINNNRNKNKAKFIKTSPSYVSDNSAINNVKKSNKDLIPYKNDNSHHIVHNSFLAKENGNQSINHPAHSRTTWKQPSFSKRPKSSNDSSNFVSSSDRDKILYKSLIPSIPLLFNQEKIEVHNSCKCVGSEQSHIIHHHNQNLRNNGCLFCNDCQFNSNHQNYNRSVKRTSTDAQPNFLTKPLLDPYEIGGRFLNEQNIISQNCCNHAKVYNNTFDHGIECGDSHNLTQNFLVSSGSGTKRYKGNKHIQNKERGNTNYKATYCDECYNDSKFNPHFVFGHRDRVFENEMMVNDRNLCNTNNNQRCVTRNYVPHRPGHIFKADGPKCINIDTSTNNNNQPSTSTTSNPDAGCGPGFISCYYNPPKGTKIHNNARNPNRNKKQSKVLRQNFN